MADPRATTHVDTVLRQAEQTLVSGGAREASSSNTRPFHFEPLKPAPATGTQLNLESLRDVELDVKLELGRARMPLEDVLKLRGGSVVALDKLSGDPVDIYAGGRLVARGEVLVVNDRFCVRVVELVGDNAPRKTP